ncbi:MAG: GNAT family N-acetyltransferase [Akkermansiaceae bacterium]|nr:GNAT family N-acetyltransferase [Akkermansiaceae bacterium]
MDIRELRQDEWAAVAELIFTSTNGWYRRNLNRTCFPGDDPSVARLFPEVYEALDPGCCLVAEIEGEMAGSCFYHPRETHVALGIMNAAEKFAGRGVARALLDEVVRRAAGQPVRLVSSALNLDSYSLYTRSGFVPFALFQDMYFPPGSSLPAPGGGGGVRSAGPEDVDAMVALEEELTGIRRGKDYRHFIGNEAGIWSVSMRNGDAGLEGFLCSVNHPGSRMLGPGVMRNTEAALALIGSELRRFGEETPVFLVPAAAKDLVNRLYAHGARNCELHVAQCHGEFREPGGILMPTFMPETG